MSRVVHLKRLVKFLIIMFTITSKRCNDGDDGNDHKVNSVTLSAGITNERVPR